jgi:hypothetical protein
VKKHRWNSGNSNTWSENKTGRENWTPRLIPYHVKTRVRPTERHPIISKWPGYVGP